MVKEVMQWPVGACGTVQWERKGNVNNQLNLTATCHTVPEVYLQLHTRTDLRVRVRVEVAATSDGILAGSHSF
jgi:hypothetical protein